jgi:MFS family permease
MAKATPYAWYVLGLLVVVYVLNFIDRSVINILAPDIKRDLHVDNEDIGFLYGTAFGVFYSLFGIPLGRLADGWRRVSLLTTGLVIWSAMTALSGFSQNFAQLAVARVGVGVGEATAGPCAYSLVSDWFPKRQRATALAIYAAGLYIGGGISLPIGAWVVKNWNAHFASGGAPFGLAGWQAAFLAVGIPGLLLALLVGTMREPKRGQADGIYTQVDPNPFKSFFEDLLTIIPPLTLIRAFQHGTKALMTNVCGAVVIACAMTGLILVTHSVMQWVVIGVGVYAVFSWANNLRQSDPVAYELIWRTPAFLCVVVGYGLISFNSYAVGAFAPTYAIEHFKVTPAYAASFLGLSTAIGGLVGVVSGGWIADQLRKRLPSGRIIVAIVGSALPAIPLVIAFTTENQTLYFWLFPVMTILSSAALGPSAACVIDLVLPRMRGTATATFFIGTTLLGLAMGPYVAGYMSKVTGDLATGILSLLALAPVSLGALFAAYRLLPKAETSLLERARAAGEVI